MPNTFTPELGQFAFGQPYKELEVPNYVAAALCLLRDEVSRVEGNNRQESFDPFGNTGSSYTTTAYHVEAYSWNEDVPQQYNFKWRDFEVSWYKYLGRGMSMNREITPDECAEMLTECLDATLLMERKRI